MLVPTLEEDERRIWSAAGESGIGCVLPLLGYCKIQALRGLVVYYLDQSIEA